MPSETSKWSKRELGLNLFGNVHREVIAKAIRLDEITTEKMEREIRTNTSFVRNPKLGGNPRDGKSARD